MAAAYAVIQLTIIEMQALAQEDNSYWNYWAFINDSLKVYSEIQVNHKDRECEMFRASYTPRQIYNMIITALKPLDKPSNWSWKHDSAAVKKSSSSSTSSAPVTIDSLIALAKSTKGIKFDSNDRNNASDAMRIMHNSRCPIDVLLGFSTYNQVRHNNFLAIRIHEEGFDQAQIIVFKPSEHDLKWHHASGPDLTLEKVKELLENRSVVVNSTHWQLFE